MSYSTLNIKYFRFKGNTLALHIIKHSPYNSETLNTCLAIATPGSAIILIEDGIYASNDKQVAQKALDLGISLYALQEDSEARGITPDEGINAVDYSAFVDLVCQHTSSHTWL